MAGEISSKGPAQVKFPFTTTIVKRLACYVGIVLFASMLVSAQDGGVEDTAPPPLRLLTQDEKNKIAGETEVKRRTKLVLELMEARLVQAESLNTGQDHDRMFAELGGFHGLIDNMLEFLDGKDKDSRKVLNNFKRFEIGLRGFTPRLEILRREVPARYELYIRSLIKYLREARAKAVEPLFDDTVVPTTKKPA